MVIKEYINVSDERLMDGFIPVVKMMANTQESADKKLEIDFSYAQFISPVFVLSLLVWLSKCGKNVSFLQLPDYLKVIGLADWGISPDKMRQSEFVAMMEKYAKKSYIPIVSFPACSNNDEKEIISSVVENIIIRQLNIPLNVALV